MEQLPYSTLVPGEVAQYVTMENRMEIFHTHSATLLAFYLLLVRFEPYPSDSETISLSTTRQTSDVQSPFILYSITIYFLSMHTSFIAALF